MPRRLDLIDPRDFPCRPVEAKMGEEHQKNARPSTREDHDEGQARKERDAGKEKGDKKRQRQQRKRPRPKTEK